MVPIFTKGGCFLSFSFSGDGVFFRSHIVLSPFFSLSYSRSRNLDPGSHGRDAPPPLPAAVRASEGICFRERRLQRFLLSRPLASNTRLMATAKTFVKLMHRLVHSLEGGLVCFRTSRRRLRLFITPPRGASISFALSRAVASEWLKRAPRAVALLCTKGSNNCRGTKQRGCGILRFTHTCVPGGGGGGRRQPVTTGGCGYTENLQRYEPEIEIAR